MAKTQANFPTSLDVLNTDREAGQVITSASYDVIEDAITEIEAWLGIVKTGSGAIVCTTAPTITTINLTGGQIAFPATAAPSADANTLDDYEEGTWTPVISFGGGTTGITYDTNTGYYTKIGNVVTISAFINMTSKGSSTGDAIIGGLPFTVVNNTAGLTAVALVFGAITYTGQYQGYTEVNTKTIILKEITEAGVQSTLTNADFANNSAILLNCTYRIE